MVKISDDYPRGSGNIYLDCTRPVEIKLPRLSLNSLDGSRFMFLLIMLSIVEEAPR